jgi:hypothetical protein
MSPSEYVVVNKGTDPLSFEDLDVFCEKGEEPAKEEGRKAGSASWGKWAAMTKKRTGVVVLPHQEISPETLKKAWNTEHFKAELQRRIHRLKQDTKE